MEREGKGFESEAEKQGLMARKLKCRSFVGIRAGSSTPPPTWKLQNGTNSFPTANSISARQLCANLWETQPHHHHRRHNRQFPRSPSDQVAFPASSLNSKDWVDESRYSLGTSKEFLKVFNRIWSLEEQHASNIKLVKALKGELDHYRGRMKELVLDKQRDGEEMDNLFKHIEDIILLRKHKEKDRVKSVVKSVREELEDERKLRKELESLHQKQARELFKVKSSFSNALKELKRERKTRISLENLCDEFARGIRDYEQELRSMDRSFDQIGSENTDKLVLHISEAWLDERMQRKEGEAQNVDLGDKLSFDIETLLQAKRSVELRNNKNLSTNELKEGFSCRHNAPYNAADEEDSTNCDSYCYEQSWRLDDNPTVHLLEDTGKSNPNEKRTGEQKTTIERKLSSLQLRFENNMPRATNNSPSDRCGTPYDKHDIVSVGTSGLMRSCINDDKSRIHSLSLEGEKNNPKSNCEEEYSNVQALYKGNTSPVQEWISRLKAPDFECSEKGVQGVKENSLKAKLLEARLEAWYSRTKSSKTSL